MREEQPTRRDAREHHLEKLLVVRLPGVKEHQVELALHLRDLLERVTRDHLDDVAEARALDVGRGLLGAHGVVLDGDELATGFAQRHADPDGAVAAGGTDFQHLPGADGANQNPQEAAVLFRDGQLALVGGPDAGQQRRHRRVDPGSDCLGWLARRGLGGGGGLAPGALAKGTLLC